jgi:hypothetical protein
MDGLTTQAVNAVVVDPLAPQQLYAATNAGFFKSRDGGDNWAPHNEGLTTMRVRTIALPATPDLARVYAGTDGGGVFWRQPPTPAFDADPRADIAVYRAATGQWFISGSSDGQTTSTRLGDPAQGDIPVPADYDCDGRRDLAIYRRSTGEWHILLSSTRRVLVRVLGDPSQDDIPVPGQ